MNRLASIFGSRVRALRKSKGITQEELARRVKLDPKFIGSVERGEKGVSFDAVERIAKALDAEFYVLFLPDDLATGRLQQHLRPVLRQIHDVDPAAIEAFFRELLASVRKLDTAKEDRGDSFEQ
jgi:transcriptional regulator with XRE-family HTH domain